MAFARGGCADAAAGDEGWQQLVDLGVAEGKQDLRETLRRAGALEGTPLGRNLDGYANAVMFGTNGAAVAVTEANKAEWLGRLLRSELVEGVAEAALALFLRLTCNA